MLCSAVHQIGSGFPVVLDEHSLTPAMRMVFVIKLGIILAIAGLYVGIAVPCNLPPFLPPQPPNEAYVLIITDPPIVETNQEIHLTLVLQGEAISKPIHYIWSADAGELEPHGPTQATVAKWIAPDFPANLGIRAVAVVEVDGTIRTISGRAIVTVLPNSSTSVDVKK